jgi:hypothetical protein
VEIHCELGLNVVFFILQFTQEEISIYCSSLKNCIISFIYTYLFNPATLQPEKSCKSRNANEVMQLHVIHNLTDIKVLPEYDRDITKHE